MLPPGQSGYVSIPGVADGTGSPHLTDQTPLFIDFRLRPFGFDQPADSTETPAAGVTIERDSFGIPSVTGETDYDAWFGVGYAAAAGPALRARALPPGGVGTPRRDPRLDLPRRRPDRAPRLLHGRRDRRDGQPRPGSPAGSVHRLPRRHQRLHRLPADPPERGARRVHRTRRAADRLDRARLGADRRAARPHRPLGGRQRARERPGPAAHRPARASTCSPPSGRRARSRRSGAARASSRLSPAAAARTSGSASGAAAST